MSVYFTGSFRETRLINCPPAFCIFVKSDGVTKVPTIAALEEISTIKVVLPPLAKQQEIANHIYAIRQQAKALHEEGRINLKKAQQEVEQMIIGTNKDT